MCKTNPIWPGRQPGPRRAEDAKRTQFGSASQKVGTLGGQRCETNPISTVRAVATPHYSIIPPFQYSNPVPIVRNEPNFRRPGGPEDPSFHCSSIPGSRSPGRRAGSNPAKQSQFGRARLTEQVLYGKEVMTNRVCQRSWQNKANFRQRERPAARLYKQSQFSPSAREWARATKHGRSRLEAKCAKQSQLAWNPPPSTGAVVPISNLPETPIHFSLDLYVTGAYKQSYGKLKIITSRGFIPS